MDKQDIEKILTFHMDMTYQDTDAGGVVFHGNYLGYGERARSKILKEIFGVVKDNEYSWAISSLSINYMRPVLVGESLIVKTIFKEVKGASILFRHEFYVNNTLVSDLDGKIVNLNRALKPSKIPANVLEKFNLLVNKE